jgi:hypothetical protein
MKIRILIILSLLGLYNCTTPKTEIYTLSSLTVVYTNSEKINEIWKRNGGRGEVYGFYNSKTKTIYCSKNNYANCGHELRHATEGHWHE